LGIFSFDDTGDNYRKLAIDAFREFFRIVATSKQGIRVAYKDEFACVYDDDVKQITKGIAVSRLDESRALRSVCRRLITALKLENWVEEEETDDSKAQDVPWYSNAKMFVAIYLATYLSQLFVRLRSLIFFVLLCPVLLLVAATSYPFQPETTILYCLVGMAVVYSIKVVQILLQVNHNDLLIKISNSGTDDASKQQESGRYIINVGFLRSFIIYVLPPLLIIVVQVSGSMRHLVESLMTLFR